MLSGLDAASPLRDLAAELTLARKLARIGMWRWDRAQNALDWSEDAYRIFRWPRERGPPSAEDFRLLFSSASAVEAEAAGRRALAGEAATEVDLQLAGGPDAPWVVAMIEAVRDEQQDIIGLRGIVQDITERKRGEQRRRFQGALLDAVGQAVIATDLSGRVIYWNAGAERLYGWSRAEAIGRPVTEVTPSDMSRAQAEAIFRELRSGRSWAGDFLLRRKDGSTFIGSVRDDPVLDESGSLVAIIGVSSDISERRAAEAEQRRLREELDRAQSIARIGSWSVDGRTGVVTWSDAMFGLMRRDPALGPTRGDEGFACFTPESADRLRASLLAAQRGDGFEVELERVDLGAWFVAQGEGMRDDAGVIVGMRGILRDITSERRVREALRASEHKLLEAQRAARIGNWEFDLRTETITWSRQMYELVGRDPAKGSPTFDELLAALTKESAARLEPLVRSTRATGIPYTVDLELRDPPGDCRYLTATGQAVRAPSGAIVGLRGTAQDITARRQAQDALVRAERLTTLGTLVAGVAHEINNPLTFIRGNIEIIQDLAKDVAGAAAEDHAKLLAEIETSARIALDGLDRIGAITQGLRMVARPSTGTRTESDVNKLVRDILPIARPRLEPARAELALAATRRVAIDANQMGQVLVNLLFNAGDALRGRSDARVELRTRDVEGGVEIEVADNGPGIPPDVEKRLFAPFFTTKADGTGLGLSVSQAIVKAHEGALTVHTRVGEGTTFRVRLPAHETTR